MEDKAMKNYALITGATSGFGYEFCKLFARDGYNLVLVARSEDLLQKVSTEITNEFGVRVVPLAVDLFKPEGARTVYEHTSRENIVVDILVNDAGQGQYGDFTTYHLDRDIDMIQLNIVALVGLTKFYLKEMVARNSGKILQVSSLLGKVPTPLMSVYAATKAFVSSFSEGLIQELKDTNVTVTALLPGAADTDFFHKAGAEETKTYREQNLLDPEKVARDGFDALMRGESKIISGVKNKIQGAMSTIMPDGALTSMMDKQMSPSDKEDGRERITHAPSREARERIQRETGKATGDYDQHEGHAHTDEKGSAGETQ
jgi:uncharacterized protein